MMDDDDPAVHRLEGSTGETKGGLVVKKNKNESDQFKLPKPSLLGLDLLAAQRRKEREESQRLISFEDNDYDDEKGNDGGSNEALTPAREFSFKKPDTESFHKLSKQLREHKDETPSHTGGVSDMARERLREHIQRDRRSGVHYSTKDYDREDGRSKGSSKRRDDSYGRDRRRDRNRDRNYDSRSKQRDRKDRSHESDRQRRGPDSSRSNNTPRFKDEPRTPGSISISGTSWEEDDNERPSNSRKSAWDFPTPKSYAGDKPEWSMRSSTSSSGFDGSRSRSSKRNRNHEDDTPRPTPAHKYNSWANERKKSGATPATGRSSRQPWGESEEDRDLWEEEQRRLDREWYNIDEGYDDENNPFSGPNSDYFR